MCLFAVCVEIFGGCAELQSAVVLGIDCRGHLWLGLRQPQWAPDGVVHNRVLSVVSREPSNRSKIHKKSTEIPFALSHSSSESNNLLISASLLDG